MTAELAGIRARLAEAEAALAAIRNGEVDALLVAGPGGPEAFTLQGAQEPHRLLIEQMSEGALTLSREGVILYANQAVARLLQTPLERIMGAEFRRFVVPGDQAVFAGLLVAAWGGGTHGEVSVRATETGEVTIATGHADCDADSCQSKGDAVPGVYVTLTVSDTGCGMDPERQSHLFEPFFTTKEQGKGTGLGLATVDGIVRQNNGFVNVYSEPGKGTTFKIYLPRQASVVAPTAEPAAPAKLLTGTETVLLVEDEIPLLRLNRRFLGSLGYTVLGASTPAEALRLAAEYTGEIHLLLTDVVMPKMSGRDLREQLVVTRPAMKCLFMSGYTADVIARRGGVIDEGLHFIGKPFSRDTLAGKLREVLEGKA